MVPIMIIIYRMYEIANPSQLESRGRNPINCTKLSLLLALDLKSSFPSIGRLGYAKKRLWSLPVEHKATGKYWKLNIVSGW